MLLALTTCHSIAAPNWERVPFNHDASTFPTVVIEDRSLDRSVSRVASSEGGEVVDGKFRRRRGKGFRGSDGFFRSVLCGSRLALLGRALPPIPPLPQPLFVR